LNAKLKPTWTPGPAGTGSERDQIGKGRPVEPFAAFDEFSA